MSKVAHHGDFCRISDAHREFWKKLNNIGARNIDEMPPEEHDDIDATVELDDEEYNSLISEYKQILSAFLSKLVDSKDYERIRRGDVADYKTVAE